MDQEQADYADPAPPSRPPSPVRTLALAVALTVAFSFLICAGLYCLLWLEVGK